MTDFNAARSLADRWPAPSSAFFATWTGMPRYYLSPHAHACIADSHVVILDAKRDKYLCLPPDCTARLRALVSERTCVIPAESHDDYPNDLPTPEMIAALAAEGLVTNNPKAEQRQRLAPPEPRHRTSPQCSSALGLKSSLGMLQCSHPLGSAP